MKTRLFSLIILFILTTTIALSQKTSFGILGGVNLQNLNGKDAAGDKLEYNLTPGFHAGINAQIPVAADFYFQPGILFSTKGAKNKDISPNVRYGISYIELPLNLVYKGLLGEGYVMLGFGPYLGYAIGGKVVPESGTKTDIEFTNVVETGDPTGVTYMRAFDAGANIFAGFELSAKIFFQLNTQLGLLKINPEDKRVTNDERVLRNTGFGLSVGYRF